MRLWKKRNMIRFWMSSDHTTVINLDHVVALTRYNGTPPPPVNVGADPLEVVTTAAQMRLFLTKEQEQEFLTALAKYIKESA